MEGSGCEGEGGEWREVDVGEMEGRGRGGKVEGSGCGGEGGRWKGGRRKEYDTFGFGRRRKTCRCLWPMERGRDVSSLSMKTKV